MTIPEDDTEPTLEEITNAMAILARRCRSHGRYSAAMLLALVHPIIAHGYEPEVKAALGLTAHYEANKDAWGLS